MDDVFTLPIPDALKGSRPRCRGCRRQAPFRLREFESGPVELGWQLRLQSDEGASAVLPQGRRWFWELRCPACAVAFDARCRDCPRQPPGTPGFPAMNF